MGINTGAFTVLCIDDEEGNLEAFRRALRGIADEIRCYRDPVEALGEVQELSPQLVLLDLRMPGMDGHEVLERLKESAPEVQVLIITGRGTITDAVAAIKKGAADVIEKPIQNTQLASRVRQFRRVWELELETAELRERASREFRYPDLIGSSEPMRRLKQTIVNVGPADIAVLIQGETGTGKELVARAIHEHSDRRKAPFVVVDCGAISETVIESELFGHQKGAFTGASSAHSGLIREADGGTVFLDEIGELPLQLQTKLLRVVQEREIRPVGAARPVPVDIRVLAASNRDLRTAAHEGSFRKDLYYRLSTITLNVPELRDRTDDIPELVAHFLTQHADATPAITGIDENALKALAAYSWPGNVRELENVIRRALVFAEPPSIQSFDLPEIVRHPDTHGGTERREPDPVPELTENTGDRNGLSLENYERQAIADALEHTGGNKKEAARVLGIAETTLYRKLKRYGQ